jgi:hypothetical protein
MFDTLNLRAALIAAGATLLLIASILIGSRNLVTFAPALITYPSAASLPASESSYWNAG